MKMLFHCWDGGVYGISENTHTKKICPLLLCMHILTSIPSNTVPRDLWRCVSNKSTQHFNWTRPKMSIKQCRGPALTVSITLANTSLKRFFPCVKSFCSLGQSTAHYNRRGTPHPSDSSSPEACFEFKLMRQEWRAWAPSALYFMRF